MDQCLFCNIANGKIPAKKVYEDDKVAAVLDINPGTQGHVLVIPKQHVEVLIQMDDDLSSHVGMVCKQLSQVLLQAFQCEGTSIFVANGPVAGQRAPHGMVHVMPRAKNDGIVLDLPVVRLDEKALGAVYVKLAESVAKSFGKEPMKFQAPLNKEEKQENKESANKKEKVAVKKESKSDSKNVKSKLDELTEFLAGAKK